MKSLLYVGGGILIGVGISWVETERRAAVKYQELGARREKAMQMSEVLRENWRADAPASTEEDLDAPDTSEDAIKVGGEGTFETVMKDADRDSDSSHLPDYIGAATQYANPDNFVPEMDYSINYIEAEDYHDDDGRPKEQITIFMGGDGPPIFMQDGHPIEDWAEKVGDSILVDFYRMVPPGEERVLFVRNNRRDEDYEVIQETP